MYTLRFPFSIPDGKEINISNYSGQLDGKPFTLKKQDHNYILKIQGFSSENSAKSYINNLWTGLMWLLLHRGLPPTAQFTAGKVCLTEDPIQAAKNIGLKEPIDGWIDGNQPAVYPSVKRIVTETALPVNVLQTYHENDVIQYIQEGASFPASEELINNIKLKTALDLYGAYFTEYSLNAKFLTLMLVLETLKPKGKQAPKAKSLAKQYRTEIKKALNEVNLSSEDTESLKALDGAIKYASDKALTEAIRHLVLTTLQNDGDQDAEEMASKAVKLYKDRGKLVHDGKLDKPKLSQSTQDAKIIVERVLKAKFLELANTKHL